MWKLRVRNDPESEKDPFYGVKSDEDPDGAAWPGLDRGLDEPQGERGEESPVPGRRTAQERL